ncbi:MAG: hypothetical protein R3F31_05735 [Verrucomicrobiales bacterium]
MAILEADINEALVQEALERAERALLEKIGSEEVAAVQASIQKSLAQLASQAPPPQSLIWRSSVLRLLVRC